MFNRIYDHFGAAGLVVAIIALITALSGAAYAAKGGLTGKQKKEVEKIAKKYAGQPGRDGAPGANGVPGTPGAKGEPGASGVSGTDGQDGKSVVVGTATSGECPEVGGATVQVEGEPASKKKVCNGKPGSPWTIGGVLPAGETLTGAWSALRGGPADLGVQRIPISFAIPLAQELDNEEACSEATDPSAAVCQVHYINEGGQETRGTSSIEFTGPSAFCDGDAGEPSADPGHLCIYAQYENEGVEAFNAAIKRIDETDLYGGASKAGAILEIVLGGNNANAYGSWAVTAEE